MRKIIFQMMISVDGFFEGPDRELDWHVVDSDFIDYAIDLLNSVDTILFGRVTYQMMAAYWPTPRAIKVDPIIAERMNNLPKIVFSPTLEEVEWQNSRLVKGNIAEEVDKLKHQPGKDMVILGSSDLAVALTKLGFIDEYRIIVNPVVLGSGKSLFEGLNNRLALKLLDVRTFSSGTVLLRYQT
ncbi:MAG TPA: dihydrofolate reductase family protein [Dongiaceae bacterium]|nr:dihydrofolate reductase family protein [Dongiaceae bacterium]